MLSDMQGCILHADIRPAEASAESRTAHGPAQTAQDLDRRSA